MLAIEEVTSPLPRKMTMPDKIASVGVKLKDLRKTKGTSIQELSSQTGIPAETLMEIEGEQLSPPLGNIISLAKILNVPVGTFFGDTGDSPFCIVRSDARTSVSRFDSAKSKSCGYSYEGLGLQKRNRQMEPFLVTLDPGGKDQAEPNKHIGEEFIFVLKGQVEVKLQDHKDILNPDDSIYYDSHVPHIISCHGKEPATILAVIYAKEEMIIL